MHHQNPDKVNMDHNPDQKPTAADPISISGMVLS